VEELAGFGATVHTCSRNEADLNECLSEWRKKGLQVTGSVCDVSSPAQREKLISTASTLFHGKLNILVSLPSLMINFSIYFRANCIFSHFSMALF
jgi:Tropinone reductase 1